MSKRHNRKPSVGGAIKAVGNVVEGTTAAIHNTVGWIPGASGVTGTINTVGKVVGQVANAAGNIFNLLNHPEWYTKLPESQGFMINTAYSKATKFPQKSIHQLGVDGLDFPANTNHSITPAAMVLRIMPTMPIDNFAVSRMLDFLYNNIRLANSSRINFPLNDLYSYIMEVRYLFALMGTYWHMSKLAQTVLNKDLESPRNLLALKLEVSRNNAKVDQWIAHIPRAITNWSLFLRNVKQLVPFNMALFDRTLFMSTGLFADEQLPEASLMMFSWRGSQFHRPKYNNQSELWESNGTTFQIEDPDSMVEKINEQLSRISSNYTVLIGDATRAYGLQSNGLDALPAIQGGLTPIYDSTINAQIRNATAVVSQLPAGTTDISISAAFSSSTGSIGFNLTGLAYNNTGTAVNRGALPSSLTFRAIDTDFNSMDAGQALSITRLMPVTSQAPTNSSVKAMTKEADVGTEVLTGAYIFSTDDSESPIRFDFLRGGLTTGQAESVNRTYLRKLYRDIGYVNKFSNAPKILVRPDASQTGDYAGWINISDVKVQSYVDYETLRLAHMYATSSLLAVQGTRQTSPETKSQTKGRNRNRK